METIRAALYEILADDHPQTVRGVFYQATVRGVVSKTDDAKGYGTVQRLLTEMRRSGDIPYAWLADGTRWMRKPTTFSSLEAALRRTAETYRRALWDDAPIAVELWVEKEALAGVLYEVTHEWDVPLMVTRGYPSLSYLHSAAEAIAARAPQQRTLLYYFGDHDPTGRDIDRALCKGIGESLQSLVGPADREATPEAELAFWADFQRIAVTEQQIHDWALPTRPTKATDTRSKTFNGASVELDAIPAATLRELARECIERHVDKQRLAALRVYEAEERRTASRLADTLGDAA